MTGLVLGIVADDLSGAAECAAHALVRVSRSMVALTSSPSDSFPERTGRGSTGVLTVDTDSRRLDAADAARAVRAAAHLVAEAPVVVKKVDSLLRGHLATEVAALADELGRTPVVAVANPALERVVRDGVLHVAGTPLHDTELWAVEPTPAPRRVADALLPLPTVLVPHRIVARGAEAVCVELVAAAERRLVAVCDAVTGADLDVVHAAARMAGAATGVNTLLVGSGALADAAVRALPGPAHGHPDTTGAGEAREAREEGRPPETGDPLGPRDPAYGLGSPGQGLLMVLGTRAPAVAAQIAQLRAQAGEVLLVAPESLLEAPDAVAARLAALPTRGTVVVALDPGAPARPADARRLTDALAAAVAPHLDRYDAAFLSGGETARAVLDRLGVRSLDVVDELETGTVLSRRPGGRLVVTRPGSFGDTASLVRVAQRLSGPPSRPAAASGHPPTHTVHTATRARSGATTEENP